MITVIVYISVGIVLFIELVALRRAIRERDEARRQLNDLRTWKAANSNLVDLLVKYPELFN